MTWAMRLRITEACAQRRSLSFLISPLPCTIVKAKLGYTCLTKAEDIAIWKA
jgi:hypothetical protein